MIHFKLSTGKGLCGARVVYSSSLTRQISDVTCPKCGLKIFQGRHLVVELEQDASVALSEPPRITGPFKFLLAKDLAVMTDAEKLKYYKHLSEKLRGEIARLRNKVLSLGGKI